MQQWGFRFVTMFTVWERKWRSLKNRSITLSFETHHYAKYNPKIFSRLMAPGHPGRCLGQTEGRGQTVALPAPSCLMSQGSHFRDKSCGDLTWFSWTHQGKTLHFHAQFWLETNARDPGRWCQQERFITKHTDRLCLWPRGSDLLIPDSGQRTEVRVHSVHSRVERCHNEIFTSKPWWAQSCQRTARQPLQPCEKDKL